MEQYGYCRVSTREQNLDRQIQAMIDLGIKEKNIITDKISGKNFERPQYNKLIKKIKSGDVIVVKSIDRLGRNYSEILEQWRYITKEKKANIQVIDMPLLNTEKGHGDLTGVFVSDLVLQILAYVAETERVFIKQRQAEGIELAKRKGVKFGRKKLLLPDAFDDAYRLWLDKKVTVREGAKIAGMKQTTFYMKCLEKREISQKK